MSASGTKAGADHLRDPTHREHTLNQCRGNSLWHVVGVAVTYLRPVKRPEQGSWPSECDDVTTRARVSRSRGPQANYRTRYGTDGLLRPLPFENKKGGGGRAQSISVLEQILGRNGVTELSDWPRVDRFNRRVRKVVHKHVPPELGQLPCRTTCGAGEDVIANDRRDRPPPICRCSNRIAFGHLARGVERDQRLCGGFAKHLRGPRQEILLVLHHTFPEARGAAVMARAVGKLLRRVQPHVVKRLVRLLAVAGTW